MPVNHAKEYLIFVHIGVVFLHFLARASNGCQYSNFENTCPKICTGTPEDMVLTDLGDSLDSDPSGFVLIHIVYNMLLEVILNSILHGCKASIIIMYYVWNPKRYHFLGGV